MSGPNNIMPMKYICTVHPEEKRDVNDRTFVYGVQIKDFERSTNPVGAPTVIKDTYGDWHGQNIWKVKEEERGNLHTHYWAMPSVVIETEKGERQAIVVTDDFPQSFTPGKTRTRPRPGTGTGAGGTSTGGTGTGGTETASQYKISPIKEGIEEIDTRYREVTPNTPAWAARAPIEWPGVTVRGSNEDASIPAESFIPGFWGIVCVNREGAPSLSSHVIELTKEGRPDRSRIADIHTLMAVVKEPTVAGKKNPNSLAIQLDEAGIGRGAGYHMFVDYSRGSLFPEYGIGANKPGIVGGPFTVGIGRCQHVHGQTADGAFIRPIHNSVETLFLGYGQDAPLLFTGQPYPRTQEGVYPVDVELVIDPSLPHQAGNSAGRGKWRWITRQSVATVIPDRNKTGVIVDYAEEVKDPIPFIGDGVKPTKSVVTTGKGDKIGDGQPFIGQEGGVRAYAVTNNCLVAGGGLAFKAMASEQGEADLSGACRPDETVTQTAMNAGLTQVELPHCVTNSGRWEALEFEADTPHLYQYSLTQGGSVVTGPDIKIPAMYSGETSEYVTTKIFHADAAGNSNAKIGLGSVSKEFPGVLDGYEVEMVNGEMNITKVDTGVAGDQWAFESVGLFCAPNGYKVVNQSDGTQFGVSEAGFYVEDGTNLTAGTPAFRTAAGGILELGGGGGSGDVTGPGSSTADNVVSFLDATGKAIKDSGIASANVVQAANVLTSGYVVCGLGGKNVEVGTQLCSQLVDVDTTGISTNDAIVWSGSWGYVNLQLDTHLSDVILSSLTDNQLIQYDFGTGTWYNVDAADVLAAGGSQYQHLAINGSGTAVWTNAIDLRATAAGNGYANTVHNIQDDVAIASGVPQVMQTPLKLCAPDNDSGFFSGGTGILLCGWNNQPMGIFGAFRTGTTTANCVVQRGPFGSNYATFWGANGSINWQSLEGSGCLALRDTASGADKYSPRGGNYLHIYPLDGDLAITDASNTRHILTGTSTVQDDLANSDSVGSTPASDGEAFVYNSGTGLYEAENVREITDSTGTGGTFRKIAETTVSAASGASVTAANIIPANARIIAVFCTVNTSLGTSNGTTGFTVGQTGDQDRFSADTAAVTAGTNTGPKDYTVASEKCCFFSSTSAENVTMYAVGGNFDGTGLFHIVVVYEEVNEPTS